MDTILTGLVALAGVWLGKQWEARSAHRSWLREKRLVAYVSMMQLSHDLYDVLGREWMNGHGGEGRAENSRVAFGVISRIYQVKSEVLLIGPSSIENATDAFAVAHHEAANAVFHDETVHKLRAEHRTLTDCAPVNHMGDALGDLRRAAEAVIREQPAWWTQMRVPRLRRRKTLMLAADGRGAPDGPPSR